MRSSSRRTSPKRLRGWREPFITAPVVAGAFFLAVALLHLLRIMSRTEAVIGGRAVPFWLSWIAVVVGGVLAWRLFKYERIDL